MTSVLGGALTITAEALPDAGHVSHVVAAQPDSGAVHEVTPVERPMRARKEKKKAAAELEETKQKYSPSSCVW